jgi:aspartate/methionine/tyrosine aminotransferase
MHIEPFRLERYFAKYEFNAPFLLSCSDCESVSIRELLDMQPGSDEEFMQLKLGYTESEGASLLREQIAGIYTHIAPQDILVHTGAEEAIFNFMNVILNKGDHIIVHYPCYQSLMEVATAIGAGVTPWKGDPANGWRLDLDDLKDLIRPNTKLVVINCPHNPTGFLMPANEFGELVNLSQKHGFIIFSDEVYRFLEYDEQDRLPAICEVDDQSISLGVMSKTYGLPGLRIGWIATRNKKLYQKMAGFKDYTTICNSAPAEYLSTIALRNESKLRKKNLEIIRRNLALLDRFFEKHGQLFTWKPPKAGPIAFPLFNGGNIEKFCHNLVTQAGVLLVPGTIYDPSYSNFRIGFGRANLANCVQNFDEYLQTTPEFL